MSKHRRAVRLGDHYTLNMAPTEKSKKPSRSAVNDVVTRDYTIHLHKNVFGVQFKKRYVFREHTGPSF